MARAEWRAGVLSGAPVVSKGIVISPDGDLVLPDKTTFPTSGWYSLRQTGQPLPEPAAGPVLMFVNGDRLPARLVDSDGTTVRVRPAFADAKSGGSLTVSLSSLSAWFLRVPTDSEYLKIQSQPRSRDALVNRQGDLLTGSIASLDESGFRLQDGVKTSTIERGTVTAVLFNTELARARKPKGRAYRVRLADGGSLTVASLTVDEKTCRLTTFGKETLELPAAKLMAVDVEQGPVTLISELKTIRQEYQSFDGETRRWQVDVNLFGRPLRLQEPQGESTYARGLGLSAGMTLTLEPGGKFKRFETLAGMDARDGRRGEVIMRLLRDGKPVELPDGGRIGLKPVEISIDVTGCKLLTVSVSRDRRAGVQEAVNFANARLIP